MEDVSPEASPLKLSEVEGESNPDLAIRAQRWGPLGLSVDEVEAQSLPVKVDSVSSLDDEMADGQVAENLETVAPYRKDGSSSGTSYSSKDRGFASSPNSGSKRETGNNKSEVGDDLKQEIGGPTVDEFGRLVREGASDSDSNEGYPFSRGRSKTRSRSRTPEDFRRRYRSRSRSPRRRIRRDSRSRSRSPRRRRSWSRSPSRDFSRAGDIRNDRGPSDRGRRGGRGSRPPLCFNFMRGRCFRGHSCRYLHQENDLAASDNSGRWENGTKVGRKENFVDEDRHRARFEDPSSDKVTKESVHVPEQEHDEKKDLNSEKASPIVGKEPEHVSSCEDDIPSDPGRSSAAEGTDNKEDVDAPVQPAKEEIPSTVEEQLLQTSLPGTSPSIVKTVPEQVTAPPLSLLPPKPLPVIAGFSQQPHEHGFGANVVRPQAEYVPPLSPLPPKPLPANAGFSLQPHEHPFGGSSLRPQQPEFPHKNMIQHHAGFSGNPLPVRPPGLNMNQPLSFQPGITSTSLHHHQSDPSLSRPVPQHPAFSAPPWSTFQPVYSGGPRIPHQPALGMNAPAMQPRFDEPSRLMQQSGPRPLLPMHQQPGFASHQVRYPPPSSSLGTLGPLSQPLPNLAPPQAGQNMSRQELPMVSGGSNMQTYQRPQLPAPVPSPVFHQSQNFTFSTPNPGRVPPVQSLPPRPQQQRLSEEPYDPLADGLEPKPPGAGLPVSNSILESAAGYKNESLSSEQPSEKDEIDALEISNRILSAARAGMHVLESVNPKPGLGGGSENGIRRSPTKIETLFANQNLKDQIHSRPSVVEHLDINSPLYVAEDPDDVAGDKQLNIGDERQRAIGETTNDSGQKQSKGKSSKEAKVMKLLRTAVTEYVKEVLKPTWREGHLSKEAFKTIAKKAVDKVISTLPGHHIPKSQDKVDRFIISSQEKISKLVQGYLDKYVKP
ncbi:hypothetical protein O6H91_17G068600 [Diphasiastrum complanatum]|nr:hypothetical protein O6H91_17G068600 [Diphasiastrum complanatum]